MEEKPTPDPDAPLSRADWRRLYREGLESRQRIRAERDRFLESQLEPGEVIVARSGDHPIVTDRRILSARRCYTPPRQGQWDCECLTFSQIARWSFGRRHDHRPLVRIDHVPVPRLEHVPEHRFLRFEWGNAEAEIDHTETLLGFGKDSDPVLLALIAALERASVPQGTPFVVRPEGTREDRMGSRAYLVEASAWDLAWMRFLIRHPWLHRRRRRRVRSSARTRPVT